MGHTKLLVEIMNASGVWTDVTPDTMHAEISTGLNGAGASKSRVGKCTLILNNRAKAYNPDVGQTSVNLLDCRRRVRLRAAGATSGQALQAIRSGAYGTGALLTVTASGGTQVIGNFSSRNLERAQSFKVVTAGQLTQFTFVLGASSGAPVGTMTWQIRADSAGVPGTVLKSGTLTPTASATNTVSVASGPALVPGTVYWLHLLPTAAQALNVYWLLQSGATDVYANGALWNTETSGAVWAADSTDAQFSITTSLINAYFSQIISTATTAADVWTLQWDARAQFDSQYNSDAVQIVTTGPGETGAQTIYTYTNKWVTYSLSFVATANATTIEPRFLPQYTGNGLNSIAVEYRSITLKKGAGANVLGALTSWTATNVGTPAASTALSVISDYWYLFNGAIKTANPAPFVNGGPLTTKVVCADFTDKLKRVKIDLPLQKSQRADQLMTTLFGVLPMNTLNTTPPGKLFATGLSTFSRAFDGYTKGKTTVMDAVSDVVLSEYGLQWYDRDGTLRFGARDFIPKTITSAAKLTITDGLPIDMLLSRDDRTIVNICNLTYHPRQTVVSGGVVLGQIQNYVTIPPIQTDGTPGTQDITITFRDATGKTIGGDNLITPLVATTDYQLFEFLPNFGDYSASPVVTVAVLLSSASQITVRVSNTATGQLFLTKLQVRGDAVYSYDPTTLTKSDATSKATYDESEYTKDLPFADDGNYCQSLCNYLVTTYKTPYEECQYVSADWRDQLAGVDVLGLELMDTLNITDAQTGVSAVHHLIVGFNLQLSTDGIDYIGNVTWETERLDANTYWILGDATYGVLGTTTRLYI